MDLPRGHHLLDAVRHLAIVDGVGDLVGMAGLVVVQADLQVQHHRLGRFALPFV